eukprot:TRINITY_DN15311_c0_g2_i3.p3 TRINITY_DN15311_c0_g2~~TRINITY_DN15311_c0_g2_i3.p3  ORF type:complete len:117 (-),score=33.55 TRINITY_DN15311_c0_g2_i3:52-402(-)
MSLVDGVSPCFALFYVGQWVQLDVFLVFFFFFFQAEDGIRDVERSRGLGDVYKRQVHRETSAKEDHEVTRAFTQLAERIITKKTEKAKDITININVNQSVDTKPPTLKERMGRCCQ